MNARRRSVDKWREDSPPGTPTRESVTTATLSVPGHTRTLYVTNVSAGGNTIVQHIGADHDPCDLSPRSLSSPGAQLDLWHDLSVTGADPGHTASTVHGHAVYVIPRSLITAEDRDPDSPGAVSDQVLLDHDDNEEILETDEEVLDDDEILDPPD